MIQLGISAFYHDSAACILIDGKVIAAAEEERFTGVKHDYSFPKNSIAWCLEEAKILIKDVDEVCWYENPWHKKDRVLATFNKRPLKTLRLRAKFLRDFKKNSPEKLLAEIGYTGRILYIGHHASHAAFSYLTSPFYNSAILCIDGVGEWDTVSLWKGEGNYIRKLDMSLKFPSSLGMLYSTITSFLGFKPNEGEYKVMGLAPYGDSSVFYDKLSSVIKNDTGFSFEIDQKYFTWEYSDRVMFNVELSKLLGIPPRLPGDPLEQKHKDLAATLQAVYEERFTYYLMDPYNVFGGANNICLGGGCAYNGVANSLAYKYFDNVYVPFAPSDAGSAIGACLYSYALSYSYYMEEGSPRGNTSPFLGPKYDNDYIKNKLNEHKDVLIFEKLTETKLINRITKELKNQKIVAWFQGRMEFGARALGNRSILASPDDPEMRNKLNKVIKKREGFRPFAPSVIEEDAHKYFDIKGPIPYMNQVVKAKTDKFPAATHVDGTCRVQTVSKEFNPRYYKLLKKHGVTLNTSFNLKDQTITISPEQAISRFLESEIDLLVIENYIIEKKNESNTED